MCYNKSIIAELTYSGDLSWNRDSLLAVFVCQVHVQHVTCTGVRNRRIIDKTTTDSDWLAGIVKRTQHEKPASFSTFIDAYQCVLRTAFGSHQRFTHLLTFPHPTPIFVPFHLHSYVGQPMLQRNCFCWSSKINVCKRFRKPSPIRRCDCRFVREGNEEQGSFTLGYDSSYAARDLSMDVVWWRYGAVCVRTVADAMHGPNATDGSLSANWQWLDAVCSSMTISCCSRRQPTVSCT